MFLAQEILVGYSSYPTPEIGRNAKRFRQLGLGYANLGALLMARGLPYDSDEGRAYAAAITALMTGRGVPQVGGDRARMGPFAGYQREPARDARRDREAPRGRREHRAHRVGARRPADRCRRAWDDALDLGEVHGYRNAQATVFAPTGTISFMMDCDTTGVEPDFSLVKSKKLVGGGEITIVNKTVPMALDEARLRAARGRGDRRVHRRAEHVVGAPYVKTEHYPVFDCAIGERAIHYMGHVKMMGAVQPFISGAISKTVNLPETATVDEVAQLSSTPGGSASRRSRSTATTARSRSRSRQAKDGAAAAPSRDGVAADPQRRRLPDDRTEVGRKFKVGDYEGYIHVGLYEDGTPGRHLRATSRRRARRSPAS